MKNELAGDETVWLMATVGRGMASFAQQELRDKLSVTNVRQLKGKLLSSKEWSELSQLRSVERLFICLAKCARLPAPTSSVDALFALRTFAAAPDVPWTAATQRCAQLRSLGPAARFRVSCKLSDEWSAVLNMPELSRAISRVVERRTAWVYSVDEPDVDVLVHANREYAIIALSLGASLAKRAYLESPELRSTTAWAIAQSARIQPGDTVLDPMCGSGTILLEAAAERHGRACRFLAADSSAEQVGKCVAAYRACKLATLAFDVMQADARADAGQVSDLPFGVKHSSPEALPALYVAFLAEAHRVLRTGGRASILTGDEELMSRLLLGSRQWDAIARHYIALGTRASFLFVLRAKELPS